MTCSMPKKITISILNGQLSLKNLKINEEGYHILPIQYFEDFLYIVSLKIMNSGIILKTFTHAYKATLCLMVPNLSLLQGSR